jgi:hypothetical protein
MSCSAGLGIVVAMSGSEFVVTGGFVNPSDGLGVTVMDIFASYDVDVLVLFWVFVVV